MKLGKNSKLVFDGWRRGYDVADIFILLAFDFGVEDICLDM